MAMTVLTFRPRSFGEPGLIIANIPCILSHLTQIFVDAAICSSGRRCPTNPPRAVNMQAARGRQRGRHRAPRRARGRAGVGRREWRGEGSDF